MAGELALIHKDGCFDIIGMCKIMYLIVLYTMAFIVAIAVSEAVQKGIQMYAPKKDQLKDYILYALVSFVILILLAYAGCRVCPEVVSYVSLSPV